MQDIEMFVNRLKKNIKKLKPWLKAHNVSCFRVYDRDIPEFAVAVDIYETRAHVQEYQAPKKVDPIKSQDRLNRIVQCLPDALGFEAESIFLKVRSRQKGLKQYEKHHSQQIFHAVEEGGYQFFVNFTDYLDTGLFLDHRITRGLIGELAKGKRFLNLFSYTGSASVYAVKGGATQATTVDMSRTYLAWAKKNFELNNIDLASHHFTQADCFDWLQKCQQRYDLIFLDPPTFSNSKRMKGSFDIQRDHVRLLKLAVNALEPEGILIFSNNLRSFKIEREKLTDLDIENWSEKTLPRDFERNPKIHNCWKISRSRVAG